MQSVKVFYYTVKKDVKLALKSKAVIFWMIIFPLLWIAILYIIFSKPQVSKMKIIVVNKDSGNISKSLIKMLENIKVKNESIIEIINMTNLSEAMNKIKRSTDIDLIIYIPENFSQNIMSQKSAKLYVYYSVSGSPTYIEIRKNMILGILKGFEKGIQERAVNISLSYIDRFLAPLSLFINISYIKNRIASFYNFLLSPLDIEFKPVKSINWKVYVKVYNILMLFTIFVIFAGISGIVRSIIGEIERKTLRRFAVMPSSFLGFVFGKLFSMLILLLISLSEILIASIILYHISIDRTFAIILISLLISALFFLSLGALIAAIVQEEREASQLATTIAWILCFIGGLFIPAKFLPPILQQINKFIPAINIFNASLDYYLYGANLSELMFLCVLSVFEAIILTFIVIYLIRRIARTLT